MREPTSVPAQSPPDARPFNPCGCGCGEDAGYFHYSGGPDKVRKGDPRRFIRGHHSRLPEHQRKVPGFDERYIVQPDGCWRWQVGCEHHDGYGSYYNAGRSQPAHRYSYERKFGPIPDGAVLDHLCHDPKTCVGGKTCPHRACVNPEHLKIETHAENCRRGVNSKLSAQQAAEIRRRRAAGERGIDLAAEFGVQQSTISWVVHNGTWTGDLAS